MSKGFKRQEMARRLSTSRSRSRSRTPVPSKRTKLIFEQTENTTSDVVDEDPPKIWKPTLKPAFKVNVTPGGSMNIGDAVSLKNTPRGSVRLRRHLIPKSTVEDSIHTTAIERTAEMGLAELEGEDAATEHFAHVRQWLRELQPPEVSKPFRSCATPPPEENFDAISGVVPISDLVEVESRTQLEPRFKMNEPQEVSIFDSGDIDVRPSTSGMTRTSRRIAPTVHEGSEFDSDFDDEFNVEEFATSAGGMRDIPDDNDLNERERNIVDAVSRELDEAVDRLLVNVSTDFVWQSDFDTFGGVPEEFSGPTPGPINDYDTPYEAFTSIWSQDFMEHIMRETNLYAEQTIDEKVESDSLSRTSRLHRWTETNVDEMYTFFAVHILMGLDSRSSQHEYWKVDCLLEMPRFRKVMSYNRYILLSKFIHFADNYDASLQTGGVKLSAKLTKIAPVLVHLNNKFSKLYNLHQDIAIDESLTLFKGRLSWVQAIRTKAARFGIKSFELCESRTGYLWKFEIYTGKNSERGDAVVPSVDLAGKTTQVVIDLLKDLQHRGHCVTMDNFYNCPALARYLKSLGFDCLGTLRANRKHVPVEIAKASKNVPLGTIVARHSGDVTCIAWKDTKMVNMISTYHTNETFEGRKAGRELVKPVVVRDYNNTMGGVDLKDQKLSMYLLERKRCLKWYMKIFKRLLNTSVLNAYIMLTESLRRRKMPMLSHRDFRDQLAQSLVDNHRHLPQAIEAPDQELRRNMSIVHVPKITDNKNRGYCHMCRRNGRVKKVNLKCMACSEFLCPEECWRVWHSAPVLPGRSIAIRAGKRLH